MNENIKAYACYNLNEEQRRISSSGGVFSVLAEYWFEQGIAMSALKASALEYLAAENVVYGVAMTSDCYGAEYIRIIDKSQLGRLRGSKYVQAYVGNTFCNVKSDLEEGRCVLFSGTGCVINGLKNFLQKEYDNLLCVDIICHGVPSRALWEKYVKYQETRYGKLVDINFRCKDFLGKDFVIKENRIYISKYKDSFMQMFLRDYCLRPSCYECKAKTVRKSDLTIADFWGITHIIPEMSDEKGTSLILVRSLKGDRILKAVESFLCMAGVGYESAVKYNPAEFKSVQRPKQRDSFFSDMYNMEFDELEKKYAAPIPLSFTKKIKCKVKRILKLVLGKFVLSGSKFKTNEEYGLLFTFDK